VTSCVSVIQLLLNYGKSRGDKLVEPIAVFGQENMSVHLPCPLPNVDTPSQVEWFDFVYNTSPEPIRIFDSRNNTNRQFNDLHPKSHNYEVSGLVGQSVSRLVDQSIMYPILRFAIFVIIVYL